MTSIKVRVRGALGWSDEHFQPSLPMVIEFRAAFAFWVEQSTSGGTQRSDSLESRRLLLENE